MSDASEESVWDRVEVARAIRDECAHRLKKRCQLIRSRHTIEEWRASNPLVALVERMSPEERADECSLVVGISHYKRLAAALPLPYQDLLASDRVQMDHARDRLRACVDSRKTEQRRAALLQALKAATDTWHRAVLEARDVYLTLLEGDQLHERLLEKYTDHIVSIVDTETVFEVAALKAADHALREAEKHKEAEDERRRRDQYAEKRAREIQRQREREAADARSRKQREAEEREARERQLQLERPIREFRETLERLRRDVHLTTPALTASDLKLCDYWANSLGGSANRVQQMLSARLSERAALVLYNQIDGTAEDLSIGQITGTSDGLWRLADIRTHRGLIDIKNARRSFSSPNSYSEWCVPRFKSDRHLHDVIVSAVLSNYVRAGCRDDGPRLWLGETTRLTIESLASEFDSGVLEVAIDPTRLAFLPPWLFEYPDSFYSAPHKVIETLRSPGFDWPESWSSIPECVLAGSDSTLARAIARLNTVPSLDAEVDLLRRRFPFAWAPTRPRLFLHVLDRFCRCVARNEDFPAQALRIALFSSNSFLSIITPLGCLDPLEIIYQLLSVLADIVAKCEDLAKYQFTQFRLQGTGILQARRKFGKWYTVYAYCGGWLRTDHGQSVRCGNNPIYAGANPWCESCGHLICNRCGYCSSPSYCTSCKPRQEKWTPR